MQNFRRAPRRRLNGVLFIDKPQGITSNGVLGVVKRLFNADKAGHTGTLDPFATGLLPVALGEATKFSGHMLDADKGYLATMQLGVTTTTGDPEGDVVETRPVQVQDADIEAVMARFRGVIGQMPPMYSALKRDGKPLYEYARAGVTLEREVRTVTIRSLSCVERHESAVTFRVSCSKGTYVRTLAEDIGRALGCGAHLTALRRESTGAFGLDGAVALAQIEAMPESARDGLLLPIDTLIAHLPRIDLIRGHAERLRLGQRLPMREIGVSADGLYRVYDDMGALTGLVQAVEGGIRPERLVAQGSPAG